VDLYLLQWRIGIFEVYILSISTMERPLVSGRQKYENTQPTKLQPAKTNAAFAPRLPASAAVICGVTNVTTTEVTAAQNTAHAMVYSRRIGVGSSAGIRFELQKLSTSLPGNGTKGTHMDPNVTFVKNEKVINVETRAVRPVLDSKEVVARQPTTILRTHKTDSPQSTRGLLPTLSTKSSPQI
jgi:hypothetical protein